METNNSCKVLLDKGSTKKVKCYTFKYDILDREIAVHVDVDQDKRTTITDVVTGLRMCGLDKPMSAVKVEDILDRLDIFLRHFTVAETLKEFKRLEEKE